MKSWKFMLLRERVWGKVKDNSPSIFFDYLLFEIQQSLVNINDLRESKDDVKEEVTNLYAFVKALAAEEKISENNVNKILVKLKA
ncbi:hypothetical protein ACFLZX_03260 [Nanoarchaeota archaeon]